MIKEARKKIGITQENLAIKLGVTQGYLSKLESKNMYYTKNTTINLVLKLSAELNICPIQLFIFFSDKKVKCNLNCHKCGK